MKLFRKEALNYVLSSRLPIYSFQWNEEYMLKNVNFIIFMRSMSDLTISLKTGLY